MNILSTNELKYLGEQIKKTISSIEHHHFQWIMRYDFAPYPEEEEYPGWTESWLKTRTKDLYYLILGYLEAKMMIHLLRTFQERFHLLFHQDKDDSILKAEHTHPEGEPELLIIAEFKRFLDVFQFFDFQQTREDEHMKLISILSNTDFIIKNCNSVIVNETDINKQVRWVLSLYYPSCRLRNSASFIQVFKTYKPDILIPELKTAVEYKYVKDASVNIDEFIDQIRSDATNYTNDYRYDNFIAVMYIQNTSIATPQAIHAAWRGKQFPDNWELVIVNGSPSKNAKVHQ